MIPYCILAIENDDDRGFMESLYLQYNRLMYAEISKVVGDPNAAEDLMQDVLIKLIDRIQKLRSMDRDGLVNYIISACKNQARNYVRNCGKHPIFPLDDQTDQPDSDHSGAEMELLLIRQSDLETMARIWPELDEKSRFLLEARYVLERDDDDIAAALGIKPASVRMALTRARKAAYQLLRGKIESEV